MADFDLFKSALDAGMAFTQMTRQRAEAIVRDFVKTGEVSRDQATDWVEDLIERSRQNTELLLAVVRQEIDARLATLATRDDLAKLASRLGVAFPFGPAKAAKAPAKKAAAKKAAPAKKAAAKKAPAKKAAATKKAAKKA
jgi:polyhydroxyalkanoate synthesis regulator phasin